MKDPSPPAIGCLAAHQTLPVPGREGAIRVLQLANYDNPQMGSFIPMLVSVLEEARARGWPAEAWIRAASKGSHPWEDEFHRASLPIRFAPAGSRRALTRWLDAALDGAQGPTVIHTHFTSFDLPALWAARRLRQAGVFWHVHTALNDDPRIVIRNMFKFGILARYGVERIFCPAPDMAASAVRRFAPRRRVEVLPNAIDPAKYPIPTDEQRLAARRRLSLPPADPVLLHFGWHWRLKGGDLFLRSVRELRSRGLPVIGISLTNEAVAAQQRDELGLSDCVRIVPSGDPRDYFAAADLFVASSRAEGSPYAVMEALASGLAVVASDLPGHELICRDLSGARLTPTEPKQIAAAIGELLASHDLAASKQARGRIEASFSLTHWAAALCDTYADCLAAGSPA